MMAFNIYDDLGIRFDYPSDWEIEETDDGARTTVAVIAPESPAFAMVTIDQGGSTPAEMVDEALSAMREEYPGLEVVPAMETIDGFPATGHEIEFFSLDVLNSCTILGFRTPRRSILIFAQWSETLGEEDAEVALRAIRASLEETDS